MGTIEDVFEYIRKRVQEIQDPTPKKEKRYRNVNYDPSKKRFRATIAVFHKNYNIGDFR